MDINYFMKLQDAYGVKSRREKELIKINGQMSKHFDDTFDTEDVIINGRATQLMIIKDTEGNTFKKKIKSKHEDKFNLGDYVEWNGQMWLVTLVDADEKTWNRGYMYLCTLPLRWQNADGKIIERYAYIEDFTKYSNGTTGNNVIAVGDNQYGITLPVDDETKKLKRNMRFVIDFDDSEQPDVYELTNRKAKLNDNQYFGRGGTMIIVMSFATFDGKKDKRVLMEDGREVWICDYNTPTPATTLSPLNPPSDESRDLSASISGNVHLKNGYSRTYTATILDNNGAAVPWDSSRYSWNIVSDFPVENAVTDNKLKVRVKDDALLGSSFLIQVTAAGLVMAEVQITIVAAIK